MVDKYREKVIKGELIGLDKLFEDKDDKELRLDLSRLYQITQEPGTLNFVKSKIAVNKNMVELENRTILEKYGIEEMSIFLHLDDVFFHNTFILNQINSKLFNIVD